MKCKALLLFFLSYGDLPVIENLLVTPKDIFNSRTDFLWFHQYYTCQVTVYKPYVMVLHVLLAGHHY